MRVGLSLALLMAAAPVAAQEGAEPADDPAPFRFGLQIAGDGTFTEPALTPQLGAIFDLRASADIIVRILAAYAYVPMESRHASSDLGGPTEHRMMGELRVGVGWRMIEELEGRLFASGRAYGVHVPEVPPVTGPGGIIIESGQPSSWESTGSIGGGTEWTLRPESSRRLELSASLGIGGLIYYRPDGSLGFGSSSFLAHGAVSVGWLFD